MLGARIAEHLLDADDAALRLLVRQETLDNPDKSRALQPLVDRGAELVAGDVTDPASLAEATRGVDVVVSALQGGREIVVDGQVALARAAVANGVRRILPSDFALDVFKATPGEHASFDLRREADEVIATLGIEQVNVLNGAFLDGTFGMSASTFDIGKLKVVDAMFNFGRLVDVGVNVRITHLHRPDFALILQVHYQAIKRFEATTVDDTARYRADPAAGRRLHRTSVRLGSRAGVSPAGSRAELPNRLLTATENRPNNGDGG